MSVVLAIDAGLEDGPIPTIILPPELGAIPSSILLRDGCRAGIATLFMDQANFEALPADVRAGNQKVSIEIGNAPGPGTFPTWEKTATAQVWTLWKAETHSAGTMPISDAPGASMSGVLRVTLVTDQAFWATMECDTSYNMLSTGKTHILDPGEITWDDTVTDLLLQGTSHAVSIIAHPSAFPKMLDFDVEGERLHACIARAAAYQNTRLILDIFTGEFVTGFIDPTAADIFFDTGMVSTYLMNGDRVADNGPTDDTVPDAVLVQFSKPTFGYRDKGSSILINTQAATGGWGLAVNADGILHMQDHWDVPGKAYTDVLATVAANAALCYANARKVRRQTFVVPGVIWPPSYDIVILLREWELTVEYGTGVVTRMSTGAPEQDWTLTQNAILSPVGPHMTRKRSDGGVDIAPWREKINAILGAAASLESRTIGGRTMPVRWEYAWEECATDNTNRWAVVAGGRTDAIAGHSKARNRWEDGNSTGTKLGNGVDFAAEPLLSNPGMILIAAAPGLRVEITAEFQPDGTVKYWFEAPCAVQGPCA